MLEILHFPIRIQNQSPSVSCKFDCNLRLRYGIRIPVHQRGWHDEYESCSFPNWGWCCHWLERAHHPIRSKSISEQYFDCANIKTPVWMRIKNGNINWLVEKVTSVVLESKWFRFDPWHSGHWSQISVQRWQIECATMCDKLMHHRQRCNILCPVNFTKPLNAQCTRTGVQHVMHRSYEYIYATRINGNMYSSCLTSNFGFVICPLPGSMFVIIKSLSTPPRLFSAHV